MTGPACGGDPTVHTAFGVASEAGILSDRGLVPACELVAGDRLADGRGGWVRLAAALRVRTDIGSERVTIPAGALGGGLPSADLVVGRAARLRLRSDVARRLVGRAETFVAADRLVALVEAVTLTSGLRCDATHLIFEQHGVFVANDVVVESLVPAPRFIDSLPHPDAATVYDALPKLRYVGALAAYEPDLPELDDREARLVLSQGSTFGADPGSLLPVANCAGKTTPSPVPDICKPLPPEPAFGRFSPPATTRSPN